MSWIEIAFRLGAATLIGALIGLDRELRHKSAGVRTIGLVSLGAALAAIVVSLGPGDLNAASRVIQGVMTGIGFLGAGVIMHHRGTVEGLTTAASIWTAAVLGAGAGLGAWPPVAIGCLLALCLLVLAGWAEHILARRRARKPRPLPGETAASPER
jgi:putative Mg2+ transporter-C (MgtC) family protein